MRPLRHNKAVRALLLFNLFLLCGPPLLLGTPALRLPLALAQEKDAPKQADALVVLGSGINCETRGLDDVSAARAAHAAELAREGWAQNVIVTDSPPETCEGMADRQREVIQKGAHNLSFYVVRDCLNTHDEALAAGKLARQHGWKSILLVTSPTHSRRAAALYRAQGFTVTVSPSVQGNYHERLLTLEDRQLAVRALRHEFYGWGQAVLKGWLWPGH